MNTQESRLAKIEILRKNGYDSQRLAALEHNLPLPDLDDEVTSIPGDADPDTYIPNQSAASSMDSKYVSESFGQNGIAPIL